MNVRHSIEVISALSRMPALIVLLCFVSIELQGAIGYVQAETVTASRVQIDGDDQRTKIVADLSHETGFTATVVPDPYRVIIDLGEAALKIPASAGKKAGGLVQKYKTLTENGHARISLETDGPVLIDKSYLIPAVGKSKPKLAVELIPTTAEVFAAVFAKDNPGMKLSAVQKATSPEMAAPQNPAAAPSSTVNKGHGKKVIVIDPGHGGIDPGAIGVRKTLEKDVVFAFSKVLRDVLVKTGRYEVFLTRDEDIFVPLRKRVQIGRSRKADLFIALHADTLRGPTVKGATIYTLSEKASDAEAEALAQKENLVDVIAGIDLGAQNEEVADILIDLLQRESKNHATLFSRAALEELRGVTAMTGKPLRSAGFVVLKAPDVPSILIELGYLSNREDEAKMTSPTWRASMATALQKAIDRHFHPETAAASP